MFSRGLLEGRWDLESNRVVTFLSCFCGDIHFPGRYMLRLTEQCKRFWYHQVPCMSFRVSSTPPVLLFFPGSPFLPCVILDYYSFSQFRIRSKFFCFLFPGPSVRPRECAWESLQSISGLGRVPCSFHAIEMN
jgi:hypothetical protein